MSLRFDNLVLRQPTPAADEALRLHGHVGTAQALRAWCLQGAVPHLAQPMALAALQGPAGDAARLVTWADAFARQLDGGTRLDALPRAAGMAWRLRVKLNDAMPWRGRHADDPWDAGWVVCTPPALRRLQGDWLPRRASLLMASLGEQAALALPLAALVQRQDEFRHPVRWLWVGADSSLPAGAGDAALVRFGLGGHSPLC